MLSRDGRFNIIGFFDSNISDDPSKFRHCSIHAYKRLKQSKIDPNLWYCPECGSEFSYIDTVPDDELKGKFSNTKTRIISAKRKRKHYDSFGALIPENDPIAIKESLGAGFKKLIYYKEDKVNEETRY